jgi:hypothetical protein
MNINIAIADDSEITEKLKDMFQYGYAEFEPSKMEAAEVWNMFHNRQWTIDQLAVLETRGQPKETFNVIKLFARMILGYYSTVVNTVVAKPVQQNDITMASMATDLTKAIFSQNFMDTVGSKLKLSAIVAGIMCAHIQPIYTGQRDQFGRPIYRISISYIPDCELVLDPMSTADDYSDARWLHRFKWVSESDIVKDFGRPMLDKLQELYNYLEIAEADFYYSHPQAFVGRYRLFDNYLLTHSVVNTEDGKRWSIFWCGEVILRKKEITHKNVKWGYRVVKTNTSNIVEYYGIFREVVETQKAINQAVVKLQLMANSQKIFVQKGSVEDITEFTTAVNRVTGVIPVLKLGGIKVENMAREAMEQYTIIDRALDRIQRILSVNDSFLGMAYASDSGRKVKLQQNATIMALQYLTERIQLMYRLIGEDVLGLANQYYTASQVIRVSDEITGDRFMELNKPMEMFTGRFHPESGEPIMQPLFEQVNDPENGEPLEDDDGNLVFAPIPEEDSELNFNNLDLTIESSAYNDEDERSQLLVESVLSGNAGQMLAQVNPAGFFKISSFITRTMKTRYSNEIGQVFEETAAMLQQQPQEQDIAGQMATTLTNQKVGKGRTPVPQGG